VRLLQLARRRKEHCIISGTGTEKCELNKNVLVKLNIVVDECMSSSFVGSHLNILSVSLFSALLLRSKLIIIASSCKSETVKLQSASAKRVMTMFRDCNPGISGFPNIGIPKIFQSLD